VTAILYLFRVPGNIRKNSESNKALIEALQGVNQNLTLLNHEILDLKNRNMVTDRILSDIAQKPIDTLQISKDWSKYPEISRMNRQENKKRES
jgi:hypothetical protein